MLFTTILHIGSNWRMKVIPLGTGWTKHTTGSAPNPTPTLSLVMMLKTRTRVGHAAINGHSTTVYTTTLISAKMH